MTPAVEWRGGVHLTDTPLWCDALRARDACFVSSARVPGTRRHKQIIATETTLRLLPKSNAATLSVPFGHPFSLGDLRLELFPSGATLGAASLMVTKGDVRIVYAGAVRPAHESSELRRCDVLVVDATFGHPRFRFPRQDDVRQALRTWVAHQETPVLLCDGNVLDVAAALDGPLCAHRSFAPLFHEVGTPVHFGTPRPGDVVLWPQSTRPRFACQTALVSGWAIDPTHGPTHGSSHGIDVAFAWSDRAGWDDLVGYVEATCAREVYLQNGGEELAHALCSRGLLARTIGPPRQLALFS